jgi:DNA-binding transcriptional MocR family regulator
MDFAERVSTLEAEGAYTMLARAQELEAAGREIIHLEIGQPDAPTFEHIARAGMQAIADGHTRYTPSAGIKSLRQAIAEEAGRRRGVAVLPGRWWWGWAKPSVLPPWRWSARVTGDSPDPGFPPTPP